MLSGSESARLYTPPLRELTPETSLGFEAVEFSERIIGRELLPWQRWWLIHSMELALGSTTADEYPRFRFDTLVLLVSRQQGKSFLLATRLLWRMCMWDQPEIDPPLILGVANKRPTAFEIMQLAHKQLRRSQLSADVSQLRTANGDEEFHMLSTEARYRIDVPSDDGGRGFSVTDLAFDELRQQRDWDSYSALENTTNSKFSSQVINVSNAGEAKSVVLRGLREQSLKRIREYSEAIDGGMSPEQFAATHDVTLGLHEWSAPDDCDIWDADGWRWAAPSMGHRVNGVEIFPESKMRAKASKVGSPGNEGIPEHKFRTENLCQWVTAAVEGPFPEENIEACIDDESAIADGSLLVLAVDTSHDRSMTTLAVAGYRDDGLPHVETIVYRAGTEWVAEVVASGLSFTPDAVIVQGRGAPASSLIEYIRDKGVEVTECQGSDLTAATGQFSDRVMQAKVRFRGDGPLMPALRETVKRTLNEVFLWDRKKSPVDAAPLCAATEALWGLTTLEQGESKISAYSDYERWW